MMRTVALTSVLVALLLPPAADAAQPTPMPVTAPQVFVDKAAPSNLFEIDSSQLALKQSTNATVLMFARRMIADHTKAAEVMAPAAQQQHIKVPGALDASQLKQMDELQKLKGKAFDDAYIPMQLMAHDQAVMLFKDYTSSGPTGPLKTFAAGTLPTLEMHQQMIHSMAGR